MRTSTLTGWVTGIVIFLAAFGGILSTSEGWYKTQKVIEEVVYEYVPASVLKVVGIWIAAIAVSLIVAIACSVTIYYCVKESERDC